MSVRPHEPDTMTPELTSFSEEIMAEHDDDNHGNSLAAWVMVGVVLLGSAIMSAAFIWPSVALFIVGVLVVIAGLVAGKVLALAGYGINGDVARSDTNLS